MSGTYAPLNHQAASTPSSPTQPLLNVNISREQADKQPWRYRGYPSLCKWMASDDDFFVVRRFSTASARTALYLQDRVAELEEELEKLDQACREGPKEHANCGSFRNDHWLQRKKVMGDLASSLDQYQRFILDHSALKARPKAAAFQVSNVKQWLDNAGEAIHPPEVAFLDKDEDLIPIVYKSQAPLRTFFDRFHFPKLMSCLRNRKMNESLYDEEDFERETTIYNREAMLDKLITCVIISTGLCMLIGPLWWLQRLSAHQPKSKAGLGVITGFLVLFTMSLSILTVAKPFEVLAATAVYGAVLMIFLQLG